MEEIDELSVFSPTNQNPMKNTIFSSPKRRRLRLVFRSFGKTMRLQKNIMENMAAKRILKNKRDSADW